MQSLFLFSFLLLLNLSTQDIILTSCARMDVPILQKAAEVACGVSCNFRNCGNSNCEKRDGRPVCVCSRCANGGGGYPPIPGKGRK